jgi:hypothetical protein
MICLVLKVLKGEERSQDADRLPFRGETAVDTPHLVRSSRDKDESFVLVLVDAVLEGVGI